MPKGIGYGRKRKRMSSRHSKRDFSRKSIPKAKNRRPPPMRGGYRL